jgi:hypothetical protein
VFVACSAMLIADVAILPKDLTGFSILKLVALFIALLAESNPKSNHD